VNALVEDAAGAPVALEDEDTGSAGAPGAYRGREAGRAAAYDDDVVALGGEGADVKASGDRGGIRAWAGGGGRGGNKRVGRG
jgi:hypothetical protein